MKSVGYNLKFVASQVYKLILDYAFFSEGTSVYCVLSVWYIAGFQLINSALPDFCISLVYFVISGMLVL